MAKLDFDDEASRLVDEFNASAGATARRARILEADGQTEISRTRAQLETIEAEFASNRS